MLVKIEAYHDGEYWCARGTGAAIFTQGKSFEELLANIREAVGLHFEEKVNQGEPLQILVLTETEVRSASKAAAG